MINAFVIDSFSYLSENITGVYSYTIKPIVQLLPQFDKINPSNFLVPARLLSWTLLAKVTSVMIGIKAVLLLLLGLWIFAYKEIAKITR